MAFEPLAGTIEVNVQGGPNAVNQAQSLNTFFKTNQTFELFCGANQFYEIHI